ncbi:MAG: LuxR C-terminal-related transcriptional regulator [Anaerolineae bacterium]
MVTTVVIADDEPVYRSGLRQELGHSRSIEIVAEAASADEALRLTGRLRPCVLLLDTAIAGMPAFTLATALRQRSPGPRVVAIGPPDRDTILAMLAAGVSGYVLRNEASSHIVRAIEAAGRGDVWYSAAVTQAVFQSDTVAGVAVAPLTPREQQVLVLLARGEDNDGIAHSLGVSTPTVRFHLRNVYRKLGLSGRGELLAWVARLPERGGRESAIEEDPSGLARAEGSSTAAVPLRFCSLAHRSGRGLG